jgi:hypothetical protein
MSSRSLCEEAVGAPKRRLGFAAAVYPALSEVVTSVEVKEFDA